MILHRQEAMEYYRRSPMLAIKKVTESHKRSGEIRDELIAKAIKDHDHSLQEIGDAAGLTKQAVHHRSKKSL